MHCEKTLATNVIKTILGEKDKKKVREDLQVLGVHQEFWLKPHPSRSAKTTILAATWVLLKDERNMFRDVMANLKLPSGFASRFKKHIIKRKLGGMKSHDYHILFQSILQLCMWHKMTQ
jgi:hypothetical protein